MNGSVRIAICDRMPIATPQRKAPIQTRLDARAGSLPADASAASPAIAVARPMVSDKGRAPLNHTSGAQTVSTAAIRARRSSPSTARKNMKSSGTNAAVPIALQIARPRTSA